MEYLMMYQNKVAIALKVGGKILREFGDTVYIPLGAEYSLLVKNLNSVRVKFRLQIDGTSATDTTWIVVPANSQVEIERFIKDGNFTSGRRFRFIERTSDIEDHRGIKADDGLIRVEFQTEQPPPVYAPLPNSWYHTYYGNLYPVSYTPTYGNSGGIRGSSAGAMAGSVQSVCFMNEGSFTKSSAIPDVQNDNGITVAGSQSQQQFYTTNDFSTTGTTDVIVLRLKGGEGPRVVAAPILVATKVSCPTCGKRSKSSYEYCPKCSTALRSV